MILALVLVGNALQQRPQVWTLYVVAACMAGLEALQRPSLDAMVPRLVARDDLSAAFAVSVLVRTTFMIAGPSLAGVLIGVIGLAWTYGVDVATYVVSLLALLRMRPLPPRADAARPSLRGIAEGLVYARQHPQLLGTYLVDMVAMFFGMPNALFPAVASGYGGARVLGLLYAAPAAGAFIATAVSGWTRSVHRQGIAIVLAALAWGAAIALFGLAPSLPLALLCLAAAGAADMVSGLFRSTIWNQTVPDRLRGRLAGIELLSYASGPALGDVESGAVASLVSVRASIVSGGVLCVAGVALLAFALPAFVRYDNRLVSRPEEGAAPS